MLDPGYKTNDFVTKFSEILIVYFTATLLYASSTQQTILNCNEPSICGSNMHLNVNKLIFANINRLG